MNCKTMLRTTASIALLCATALLIGCSGSDDRVAVSGTVTLDGRPLDNAAINFQPTAGNDANSAGGGIKAGKFTLPAGSGLKPGKYTVNVMARKETGRMIFDPQRGKKTAETVPAKIKENGSLTVTIESGGEPLQITLTTEAGPTSLR